MKINNKEIPVVALANAGYESDENEILLPGGLARKFKLKGGRKERYHTAGGDVYFKHLGKATVRVITEDKKTKPITAKLYISPYEDEVIINDKLIEELGIDLLKVKKGIWRFWDDPPTKERPSEPKQTY